MYLIGAIALIGMLIGAGLGSCFRVFVLIPVALVSVMLVVLVCLANQYDFQSAFGVATAILIAPQIGYLAGSGIQGVLGRRRVARPAVDKPMVEAPLTRPAD